MAVPHISKQTMLPVSKDSFRVRIALEAKAFTVQALKAESRVCLVSDPAGDEIDKYGRLLRYVYYRHEGKVVQLNARLVRLGYARLLYPYAKGVKYEQVGLKMQAKAAADKQGGWGACGWK